MLSKFLDLSVNKNEMISGFWTGNRNNCLNKLVKALGTPRKNFKILLSEMLRAIKHKFQ